MRMVALFLALSFCQAQDTSLLKQKLLGSWNICSDSQIDNPPSFLNCIYTMNFDKSGKFEIIDSKTRNLVANGLLELTYHSEINKKKLYELNLIEDGNKGFDLEDFPSTSVILFSANRIIFLTDDGKDLASPYFLKKIDDK